MQSIGEVLKSAREAKGLTLQQVEDETNMRWKYLEALEQENFAVIPGKAYIKGFLRNYAAFLGLDCDVIINQYRQTYEVSEQAKERIGENEVRRRKSSTAKKGIKWPLAALYAVVALGIIYVAVTAILAKGTDEQQPAESEPPSQQQQAQNQPKTEPQPKPPTEQEPVREPAQEPAPESTPDSTTTKKTENGEVFGASAVEASATGEFEIKLQANDGKSWLKVLVDGQKVYEGFIDATQTQTYKAKTKIAIRLGNAGAVTVLTNGQTVGKLGQTGQVVNWEFTK